MQDIRYELPALSNDERTCSYTLLSHVTRFTLLAISILSSSVEFNSVCKYANASASSAVGSL